MKIHPLANLIPPMSGDEYENLKDSIKSNGLLNPIILFEDSILDGKHRFKACSELKIKPKFQNFHENGVSAIEFIVSQNLDRRNLNPGQKACAACNLYDEMKIPHSYHKAPKDDSINERQRRTSFKVATLTGARRGSIEKALYIRKRNKGLFDKVFSGEISLQYAYSQLLPKQCKHFISMPKERLPNDIKVPQVFDSLDTIMIFHKQLLERDFHATFHATKQGWACRYVRGATFKIACFGPLDYAPCFRSAVVRGGREALGI